MDDRLFRWFNSIADASPWLHGAARTYAVDGIVAFAVLLLLAWWDARSAEDVSFPSDHTTAAVAVAVGLVAAAPQVAEGS